ncbi:Putative flippase GtrA (transmembrane translocase of bactoprenol-linked glucose) [Caballeronia arationis]|uniref:Flippase GtrA (Transmembrane translocase of bactoprenol-linked glucose) n=1 Tax=Caballeronia arationis TaxID=1777142 RepID=A0A7Z7I904_9BURK|nr:GtrA family protein [Caballeronia arationis]SOE80825.1 Putative flippase GtrA (transmembrane translocase of bactoprenol-linked glucose) [Caballeronia arationis]
MTRAHTVVAKTFVSKQFFVFLLTGGFAAAVNWGSRIVFNRWMPFSAAIVVAYIAGMITAFVLARIFVFKSSSQSTGRSILFFTLVNLVAVLQTWAVSVGLAYYVFPQLGMTWHDRDIAHLIGVMIPVFTSYIGHKKFSFRH